MGGVTTPTVPGFNIMAAGVSWFVIVGEMTLLHFLLIWAAPRWGSPSTESTTTALILLIIVAGQHP